MPTNGSNLSRKLVYIICQSLCLMQATNYPGQPKKNTPDEIFVSFLFIALGTRGIEKNIRRYRKL